MRTAHELLDRLTGIGATVRPAGDRLIVRAGARPIPAKLVRSLRETKAEVLATLAAESVAQPAGHDGRPAPADATLWRDWYIARVIHWLHGDRPRAEAEGIAYGELLDEWRKQHGQRWPDWQCAGCHKPIGGLAALTLADENRVHFDEGLQCLIRFGRRWRSAAASALYSLGLDRRRSCDE